MEELQRKQKLRRVLYSIPSLVILLLIAVAIGRGSFIIFDKERTTAEQADDLRGKASALSLRGEELLYKIERLNTEEGVREEIRRKFNVAEEGEQFVIIVDVPENTATDSASTTEWYKKIWDAIIPQ